MSPIRYAWIAAALAACATSEPQWEKPGASQAAVQDDTVTCRQQARLTPPPLQRLPSPSPSVSSQIMSREEELAQQEALVFQRCMRDKGYSTRS
jgi:hypothetical protein